MSTNRGAVLAEAWHRTLTGIPTVLGRLAYLTSLRNANTGAYEHFGLSQKVGAAEVDRLLRGSHVEIFQEWLCFDLERQKGEVEEHFSTMEGDKREMVANWLSLEPYVAWVPAESREVERRLFQTDLAVVLELIRTEYGVASRDPDS